MRSVHHVWILTGMLSVALAAIVTSAAVRAQDDEAPPSAEGTAPVDTAADGQALYQEYCGRCHGDTGQADTRMGQRFETQPFTNAHMLELGPEGMRAAIVEGRENMNPLTDLTPEQLDALVAYSLTLGQ